jgi:hypothetical protein
VRRQAVDELRRVRGRSLDVQVQAAQEAGNLASAKLALRGGASWHAAQEHCRRREVVAQQGRYAATVAREQPGDLSASLGGLWDDLEDNGLTVA